MKNINSLIGALDAANIPYKTDLPLSEHSTFRIGGGAALALLPRSCEEMISVIKLAKNSGEKYSVIGNGSNILFSDAGYDGIIILTEKMTRFSVKENRISAGCGLSFTRLAVIAKDSYLTGLEFAYGIPGTVGGAVYMNAGAYGGETRDVLDSAIVFNSADGRVKEYKNSDCGFDYRASVFSKNDDLTVLSADFVLKSGNQSEIVDKMSDLMSRRKEKQPLEYPNAGSTFKRPEGYFAGKLIEDSGLKGYRIGGAEVSPKHAGFIVNVGGATADDVLRLIEHIKETVLRNYGVTLECEIKYVD